MKVLEKYAVPIEQLTDFLSEHINTNIKITEMSDTELTIHIEQDYTEPEFHMGVLFNLAHRPDATIEEKNAVDYAIGAIKTLVDMGVLKEND